MTSSHENQGDVRPLSETTSVPGRGKRFRVAETIIIRDVADKFAKKSTFHSAEFFCSQDPKPPTFRLHLQFGEQEGTFAARIAVVEKPVSIKSLKFVLFDHENHTELKRMGAVDLEESLAAGSKFGWVAFYKPADATRAKNWRLACQFAYSTSAEKKESEDSTTSKVQDDFLKMLEEPNNSDFTFFVKGEQILAHKAILSARSKYFKAMFGADVTENVFNKVEIPDVKPKVFKGLLQFLYSGLPPKNLPEIALDLLVVADKYCVEEIEEICVNEICENLDANNVTDVLLVADRINNETLLDYAKEAFRGHIDSFKTPVDAMLKLKDSPDLLLELMVHYCKS